jgi:hypothetical protein
MIPASPLRGRGDCAVEEIESDRSVDCIIYTLYIMRFNLVLRFVCKICLHCDAFLLHLQPA